MIYMLLSNNPSPRDINSSNLSCSYFCCHLILSKLTFSENSLRNTIRVSNSLDPAPGPCSVSPDLGSNFKGLQMLFSRQQKLPVATKLTK